MKYEVEVEITVESMCVKTFSVEANTMQQALRTANTKAKEEDCFCDEGWDVIPGNNTYINSEIVDNEDDDDEI